MSTQRDDRGGDVLISTLTAQGSRRKLPRNTVRIPKGERKLIKAEMLRQAKQARLDLGVEQKLEVPVV